MQLLWCFVLITVVLPLTNSADDWPRWRGPDLNGISKESGWTTDWPAEGPRQLWSVEVGIGFSSVSVAKGLVYTMGHSHGSDTVFCLKSQDGTTAWSHSYPCALDAKYYEGGPGSTPTLDNGKLYTLSKRGDIFCFEAATGRIIWKKNIARETGAAKPEWGFAGSPLIEGNLVLLNLGGAGTALDKETGKVVWASDSGAAGYATPLPFSRNGERHAAIFSAKALVGIRIHDGKELWRYPWTTHWDINAADPVLVEDKLFISSWDHGATLLDLSSGKPVSVWENKNMANHFNGCIYWNGYLYGIRGNTDQPEKDLRCLDAHTGQVEWTYKGFGLGSLTCADGKLIILSDRGELAVAPADPKSFRALARAQVLGGRCWTTPVLANGRLYCRNAAGTLICLDVAAK